MKIKREKRTTKGDNLKKVEFLFELALGKVKAQKESWNSLERKTGLILGFIATTLGAIAILKIEINKWVLAVAVSLLIISMITSAFALWPRNFWDPFDFSVYYTKEFLKNRLLDIKNQALADIIEARRRNFVPLKSKSKSFRLSLISLCAGIIILSVGALVFNFSQTNERRKEVEMTKQNQNQTPTTETVEPVKPSPSVGTALEKDGSSDNSTLEPVKPSPSVGTADPFGETKGGIKPSQR